MDGNGCKRATEVSVKFIPSFKIPKTSKVYFANIGVYVCVEEKERQKVCLVCEYRTEESKAR